MADSQGLINVSSPTEEDGLLDRIVREGELGQSDQERGQGKKWVRTFLEMAQAGELTQSPRPVVDQAIDEAMEGQSKRSIRIDAILAAAIADLDEKVSEQLNEFIHEPKFQRLEAAWRGLRYLVDQTETSTTLKIKALNVSKQELQDDLDNAPAFDQSVLFKRVYEEEYGQLGGEPYGLLVGDFEFGRSPTDVKLLKKISGVAAAAHAPFIAGTAPSMFGWKSHTELGNAPGELARLFDNELYAQWKSFRESEDSRYVGLALPHMLLRDPYGEGSKQIEAFNFDEKVDGRDHSKYLWGNAAYALAARITYAFAQHEWCAAIRGVEGGGLVEGLPAHTFRTDDGDIALKCPTEIAISDRREVELSNLGFISLMHHKGSDKAVFMGTQSIQKALAYLDNDANANARLSAQLQYMLAISRFAHFLKVIMRDKIGSFTSREVLERDLNSWIANYVLLNDTASQEAKASHPLRAASIEVVEVEGKPGAYNAVALLQPHYQLDELNVSLRLVARIPEKK
jgi:type VI secretion system protein ImpC